MLLSHLDTRITTRPDDVATPHQAPLADGLYSKIVNRYRPSSVLRLLLIGFALVALPLGAGLVTAFFTVDLLGEQSKQVVLDSVRGVQAGNAVKDACFPGSPCYSPIQGIKSPHHKDHYSPKQQIPPSDKKGAHACSYQA